MQILVHFGVGMLAGLTIVLIGTYHPREEFLILFGSAFWAVIPESYWIISTIGFEHLGNLIWQFKGSIFANVFWFHHIIDQLGIQLVTITGKGNAKLEGAIGIFLVLLASFVYYQFNDWSTPDSP